MMREEIAIEIMLDHSQSNHPKIQMDPPVDSPTATLSCFSDGDMKEEDDDLNMEHANLVARGPQSPLAARNDSFSIDGDNSIINDPAKHGMEDWKRERQELLQLRSVVAKQQEQQQELEAKLEAYRRQQLGSNGTDAPRDPNGHHVPSISNRIDEIVWRNLNCFPEDEIAGQLQEVQVQLEASQKQVHDLQDELIESRASNEKSNQENAKAQETLQDQLKTAQDQLEAERRKREDAMNVHKLQVDLQQMRAKEEQEELNLTIDYWKDQFEKIQKQLYYEDAPLETVGEEEHERAGATSVKAEEDNDSQRGEDLKFESLETVPEEQRTEGNSDVFERGIETVGEEEELKLVEQKEESQRPETLPEKNDTIDALQKEVDEVKKQFQESADHLIDLESVILEMSLNQQTMVQKIQGVVRLLQDTQKENAKLDKEKSTLVQKIKRLESEKLKKEKLALEKQRREKLTRITRNARR